MSRKSAPRPPTPFFQTSLPRSCRLPLLETLDDFLQSVDKFSILVHRAHRHPDMFGKLIAAHGPHDDTLAEQLLKHFLAFADAHQNKIGMARHELQAESVDFSAEELESFP